MKQIQFNNPDLFAPKNAWDKLSLAAKAEMMKVAVKNGIYDLQTIRNKYNEFAEGGEVEEEEELPPMVPFKQRTEVIITLDPEYNQYLNTLPDNQRFTPNNAYDSYYYWKLNGKPKNFEEAYSKGMFHYDHSDNSYHANSIAFGDDGVGYFMKPKTHDTVGYETDWFSKGLITEEGGHQRHMTPEEKAEWLDFRSKYMLTNDPARPNYYMYKPKKKFATGGSTRDDDLVDWIIKEEGFNTKPEDIGDGKVTLGSGLTNPKWHQLYKQRGNKWSAQDNRRAVAEEVASRRRWAEKTIPNWDSLPESSQKALLSYKYNYDFTPANSPKLFKALKDSNLEEAARQMDATSKDPKFKKGLMDRRLREQALFLRDVHPFNPEEAVSRRYIAPSVSTRYANPFATQVENTYIAPQMVPDGDSYVKAHRLTESEDRINKFNERMEAIDNFNILMRLIDYKNNPVGTYQSTSPLMDYFTTLDNSHASGGKIHIKPENRGKFTALKKRTGHSATWFKEHGTPAQKKMAVFALNAKKWKHSEGGPLFDNGGDMGVTFGHPYYSYDTNGKLILDEKGHPILNYNASPFDEVVIIPDSKKTPAQRNTDERARQRNLRDYDENRNREYTARQIIQAQRDWENSAEKKALDYAQAATTGIGIGADIVSGLPIYSSLKGASTLSRAETPLDYVEGGMWLAPLLGGAYQTTKPIIKQAVQTAIDNGGFAVSSPRIGKIFGKDVGQFTAWVPFDRPWFEGLSWINTGEPTAEGLPVQYITSKHSGEGRKLYDTVIKKAREEGYPGIVTGRELISAPKTYNTLEHWYPNKVKLDDMGHWSNDSMTGLFEGPKKTVYTLDDFIQAISETPNERVHFLGAPRYRLETPSVKSSYDAAGIRLLDTEAHKIYPAISDEQLVQSLREGKKGIIDLYNSEAYRDKFFNEGFSVDDLNGYLSEIQNGLDGIYQYSKVKSAPGLRGVTTTRLDTSGNLRHDVGLNIEAFPTQDRAVESAIHEHEHVAMHNFDISPNGTINPVTGKTLEESYPYTVKVMKHNESLVPEIPEQLAASNDPGIAQFIKENTSLAELDTRIKTTQAIAQRRGMTIDELLDTVPEEELPVNTQELIQIYGKNNPALRNMLKRWLVFTGSAYIGASQINQ